MWATVNVFLLLNLFCLHIRFIQMFRKIKFISSIINKQQVLLLFLIYYYIHMFTFFDTAPHKHQVISQSISQTLNHTKLFIDTDKQGPWDLDTF